MAGSDKWDYDAIIQRYDDLLQLKRTPNTLWPGDAWRDGPAREKNAASEKVTQPDPPLASEHFANPPEQQTSLGFGPAVTQTWRPEDLMKRGGPGWTAEDVARRGGFR